jgi:hypothetical protein
MKMKKNLLFSLVLVMLTMVFMSSCIEDEENKTPAKFVPQEGWYDVQMIQSTQSIFTDIPEKWDVTETPTNWVDGFPLIYIDNTYIIRGEVVIQSNGKVYEINKFEINKSLVVDNKNGTITCTMRYFQSSSSGGYYVYQKYTIKKSNKVYEWR